VGHTGRYDYNLAVGRFDGRVAHREGGLTLVQHEDLRVRVGVQTRAAPWWCVRQEERNVRIAVVVPLELVGGLAVGELVIVNYVGHGCLLRSTQLEVYRRKCTGAPERRSAG
jgi:hypothetical protein